MIRPDHFRTSPDVARPLHGLRGALRLLLAGLLLAVLAACGTTAPPEEGALALDEVVTPATGDATDTVTLTGENIAGNATVLVCGEAATDVVVRDADGVAIAGDATTGVSIEFNPPELATDANCDVVVSQGVGADAESVTLAGAFDYDAGDPEPGPLAIDPDVDPTTGNFNDTVTLTGENIAGDATVTMCGQAGTSVEVLDGDGVAIGANDTNGVTLTFSPPVLTADDTCDIVVTQGEGDDAESVLLDEVFTYVAEVSTDLTLADIEPASGAEGDTVVVTGLNIAGDATVTVCGEAALNVVVLDESDTPVAAGVKEGVEIQFDVPAGIADGECDVVVTQDAESVTLTGEFTHVTPVDPIRINAGGPELVTSMGTFIADAFFVGGSVYTDASPIEGTEDDELYQTERDGYVAPDHGGFSYEIPVENGEYTLVLHFAELFIGTDKPAADGTGVGSREFSYTAEGDVLEAVQDIYLAAGEQPYTVVVETYTDITVDDGVLNLEFIEGLSNSPFVSAIEVLPQ